MLPKHTTEDLRVLVTGATGYVGGRLVPRLLEAGYRVRVLVRDPSRLRGPGRPWADDNDVEVFQGDVFKPETLNAAMEGIWAAYYLIHSMSGHSDFESRDVTAARNFGNAARSHDVERIIYLGGLGDPDSQLSDHLRSRHETGDTLRESGIPVTEFRAAVIVGSGSISFEMVRYLTERVPVMVMPKWVTTRIQPIAIRSVLSYLIDTLQTRDSIGKIIEIGGADVLTYRAMMLEYARQRNLKRLMIPVPVLTPRVSSHWVQFVTPIPSSIARPLIDGLRNEVIVRDDSARRIFPHIEPMSYEGAVKLALERLEAREVETSWSDSLHSSQGDHQPVLLTSHEGMLLERRTRVVNATPRSVYTVFTGIGGKRGWFTYNWAWRIRGLMDSMVGGVGFRRGRRDPDELRAGEALDFWRVESIEEDRLLRLRAEMKLPGRGWLQFKVEPLDANRCRLTQIAFFAPKGLFGLGYWYALYPMHGLVFGSLIREISDRAEASENRPAPHRARAEAL
jgi:uncharacterized protein YbjT (DUF2867 family)